MWRAAAACPRSCARVLSCPGTSADWAGSPRGPDLRPRLRFARQLLRQPQQRIGRTVHDFFGDVNDPAATGPGRGPEQIERLAGAQPVAFGQNPDGLLDPDPRGQRVLELAHRHGQPRRFIRLGQRPGVPGSSPGRGSPGFRRLFRARRVIGFGRAGIQGRPGWRGRRPAGPRAPSRWSGRMPLRRRRPNLARAGGRPSPQIQLPRSSAAAFPGLSFSGMTATFPVRPIRVNK